MKFTRLIRRPASSPPSVRPVATVMGRQPLANGQGQIFLSVSNIDGGQPVAIAQSHMPIIPAGAQYTIFMPPATSRRTIRGTCRTEVGSRIQHEVDAHDWYVVTGDSQSRFTTASKGGRSAA